MLHRISLNGTLMLSRFVLMVSCQGSAARPPREMPRDASASRFCIFLITHIMRNVHFGFPPSVYLLSMAIIHMSHFQLVLALYFVRKFYSCCRLLTLIAFLSQVVLPRYYFPTSLQITSLENMHVHSSYNLASDDDIGSKCVFCIVTRLTCFNSLTG